MQKTNENNLLLIPNHTLQIADEQLQITALLLTEIANETEDVYPEFFELLLKLAHIAALQSNNFKEWKKRVRKKALNEIIDGESLLSLSMQYAECDDEVDFFEFLFQFDIPKNISADEQQSCEQIIIARLKKTDDFLITNMLQPIGALLLVMSKEYFTFDSWAKKMKSQLEKSIAQQPEIKNLLKNTSFQNLDNALKATWNFPMNENVFEIINQQKPNEFEKQHIVGKTMQELALSFCILDEKIKAEMIRLIDIDLQELENK
jgi:hypothetical protein